MASVRRRDTKPELLVRKIAHALGARYRLYVDTLPGRPDLVFPSRRLVIFVHGCFWHRHLDCRLTTTPSSNVEFWVKKFDRNIERDIRKEAELTAKGWSVKVIWECETRNLEGLSLKLKEILFPFRSG
ncbi:DNA mismatch endonuclease Vsr [Xanthomonas sp. PPL139]